MLMFSCADSSLLYILLLIVYSELGIVSSPPIPLWKSVDACKGDRISQNRVLERVKLGLRVGNTLYLGHTTQGE